MSHASDEQFADGLVFTDAGFDFFMEKLDYETQEYILDTQRVEGLPIMVREDFHRAKVQAVIMGMFGLDYVTVFAPEEMSDSEEWPAAAHN